MNKKQCQPSHTQAEGAKGPTVFQKPREGRSGCKSARQQGVRFLGDNSQPAVTPQEAS